MNEHELREADLLEQLNKTQAFLKSYQKEQTLPRRGEAAPHDCEGETHLVQLLHRQHEE
jgi:hypothetical protein